ncbi:uncharacterized protein PRCAT00005206001 [Priceomyces carsonii]|uniref:uncharacterized protein n=1 Tax=Priceomyces carsonii TaxID=28549 RepID=UPI002EDB4E1F|nr:unnamed protein product [Priceomyces carsonii]
MATSQSNNIKKCLSLFTFNLNDKLDGSSVDQPQPDKEVCKENEQLSSPMNSPLSHTMGSLPENEDTNIFERSVQDLCFELCPVPKCNKCTRKKSCSHNSSMSLPTGQFLRNEDMIPAALDASTTLLNDSQTNLDQVEMIYPNRRNSSVLSLNMALGRPFSPSRKNSSYSMKYQISPQSPNGNMNITNSSISNSNNSTNNSNASNSNANSSSSGNNTNASNTQQPTSPPKLTSSRSSLSFYSYADMINTDEFARRPSIKQSYSSQGFTPLSKNSFAKNSFAKQKLPPQSSQLSRQLSGKDNGMNSLQKFLISPESSDEEQENNSLKSKRKSISSAASNNLMNDNESLISSSVGDCLRRTTTEINGN